MSENATEPSDNSAAVNAAAEGAIAPLKRLNAGEISSSCGAAMTGFSPQALVGNFLDIVKNKYMKFEGRARRKEFWMYALAMVVVNIVTTILVFIPILGAILCLLIGLGLILPGLSLAVRRLHDVGLSGWWLLAGLVPVIGGIYLLLCYLSPSVAGDNKFGPNPKTAAPEAPPAPQA